MLKNSSKKYFQNRRASDKTLRGNCNAGVVMSADKGYHEDVYMWVMEHGISNIISMGLLEK